MAEAEAPFMLQWSPVEADLEEDSWPLHVAPPAKADPAARRATAPIMAATVEMRFMLALLIGFRRGMA